MSGDVTYYLGGTYNGMKWIYNPQKRTHEGKQCVFVTDSNGTQYDDFEFADDFENQVLDVVVSVDIVNRIILDIDIPF